jgi:hypothetical protein
MWWASWLSTPVLAGGKLSFNLTGVPGNSYAVESSTNLTAWLRVETNTAPFTFVLTNAAGNSQEYFRAVYVP